MKPVHERNQECLPPKKRDLPVNNNNTATNNYSSSSISSGAGGSTIGSGGGEEATSSQSSGTSGEPQSGGGSGEWVRAQPSVHFSGVEGPEGLVGLTVDQYSMLYKVTLPTGTYSPTSLHPVLSHISPAYTVPSPVLQHTSVPYPALGYTQIPHSSLQFVSSPYATAVPYAVPPGFVPSPLISHQSAIPQPHPVSHLVPYPSVIQEGVVSSSPQQQVSSHAYTKIAAPGGVPLVLPSEQAAAQQQLGTVGILPAAELSPRGVPVFYHPAMRGIQPQRDMHSSSLEQEREVNGGDRDPHQDAVFSARNSRLLQVAPGVAALEPQQDKILKERRQDGRVSPGQRSTPDTDLEVQQVVGRLTSPVHGMSRKESAHVPLNLSQRSRESQGEVRSAYTSHPAESRAQHQQIVQPGHAVILANGQPVLVPLDYHPHQQQQQQQQQHYSSQPNDVAAAALVASPSTYTKAVDASAAMSLPERAVVELTTQQCQEPSQQLLAPASGGPPQAPLLAPSGPSHFMKGAIIQLATGELKRVEDLQTQDFVRSAEVSGGLKIDSSMVVDIHASQQRPGLVALHFNVGEQQSKVTIDVPPEHPFFVFGQGWSSCSPERTAQLYGLTCHQLQVGDVCVSVTLAQQAAPQQKPSQQQLQQVQARTPTKANSTSGAPPQPMGPPAPQNTRPQSQLKMDRIYRERDRDKEESMQVGGLRHADVPPRPNRTSAEHTQSQSNYYLHTEGHGAGVSSIEASQRRWSAPGFQRYSIKNEEGNLASVATSGPSRPSFIPQEVKLSIEGRSNAGK
ncbi:ataxin-1-like [Myxocyprinus asiaticus]|uniref:ataxin-1-like n=1 Tax=Myxocyprinus asiaticus TaxID=70543 RepID=UPI0022238305|nr:ataxin-1-like [Myxocyprinus asiaticus]